MNLKAEYRQRFLTPLTLRTAQLFYTIFRNRPFITKNQKKIITPFFIIGSGRCGSTLLRSLLISHDHISIPPESETLPNVIKKYVRYNGADWKDIVNIILGEFSSSNAFKYWDVDIFSIKEKLYSVSDKDQSLAVIIDAIYRLELDKNKPEASLWGDKTPFNTLRLKWIHRVFPNAKYIHLIRDGRDVLNSYLKSGLETNVSHISWRWNTSIEKALLFEKKKKNKNSFITIHYEELVNDPSKYVKEIYKFLDLPDIPYSETRNINDMGDVILKHHENIKNPINSSSVGKWINELSDEQKKSANKLMSKYLRKFNYLQ